LQLLSDLTNDAIFVDVNNTPPYELQLSIPMFTAQHNNLYSAAYSVYIESKRALFTTVNSASNNPHLTGVKIKLEFCLSSRYFIHWLV
jgi:hypothetical protein